VTWSWRALQTLLTLALIGSAVWAGFQVHL